MQIKWSSIAVCAILLISGNSSLSAQCNQASHSVVQRFFDFDLSGYRLGSEGHDAIWQVTEQNGEPPEAPIVITKGSEIISERLLPNGVCSFGIHFVTYGSITETDDGLQFQVTGTPDKDWTVQVRCAGEKCLINLEFDHFKIPPHPGKEAADQWLEGLGKVQKTAAGSKRISLIRKQIAVLP